jgi:ATP-dependent helicase YprA (DUF1998 family)
MLSRTLFHPSVTAWFEEHFKVSTPAQADAWPLIKAGRNALIAAPTGSGKTLAAFLAAIDDLVRQGVAAAPGPSPINSLRGRALFQNFHSAAAISMHATARCSIIKRCRTRRKSARALCNSPLRARPAI